MPTVTTWQQAAAPKPHATVMKISPELAQKFLEGNTHNRPIHDTRVQRYATDMKAGRWRLTHQGIAFTKDPINHAKDTVLIDGQHRLYAIFDSGVTIESIVSWNFDLAEQDVIDDHLTRNVRDVMALKGSKVSTLAISVANMMRKQGAPPSVRRTAPSRTESIAYIERHMDAVSFAIQCFPRKMRGIVVAPVVGAVARAWYTQPHVKLQQFAAVLLEGRSESSEDDVVIMLRNWLIATRAGARGMPDDIYGKTARAVVAYVKGERIRKLYPLETEPFKVPGDGAAVTPPRTKKRKAS